MRRIQLPILAAALLIAGCRKKEGLYEKTAYPVGGRPKTADELSHRMPVPEVEVEGELEVSDLQWNAFGLTELRLRVRNKSRTRTVGCRYQVFDQAGAEMSTNSYALLYIPPGLQVDKSILFPNEGAAERAKKIRFSELK